MDLFEKYNLKFKEINGLVHIVSDLKENQILAQYLDLWSKSDELRVDFLPELNLVLNGKMKYNDIDADVVGLAYFDKIKTKIIGSEVGYLDMELPTKDFKNLIIEWLEFLESHGR